MLVVDASALLEFLLQTPLGTRIEARLGNGMVLRAAFLDMPLDGMAAGDAIVFAYDPERITVFGSPSA